MKLSDLKQVKTLQFPNHGGLEIKLNTCIKMSEMLEIQKKYKDITQSDMETQIMAGLEVAMAGIQERNLEDDDGYSLPITIENIKELPHDVIAAMNEELNPEKKKM